MSRKGSITLVAQNFARLFICTTFFLRDISCVLYIQVILLQPQHDISGEYLYYRKQSFIPRSQGEKRGLPLPNLNKFNLLYTENMPFLMLCFKLQPKEVLCFIIFIQKDNTTTQLLISESDPQSVGQVFKQYSGDAQLPTLGTIYKLA